MRIGVLALQGGVAEHINHLIKLNCEAVEVRKKEELEGLNGIILPGGESTTIGKLLRKTGIFDILRNKILEGLPVWGTCAGMILLAKDIENDNVKHLATMDITVRRNAYGSQIDSFLAEESIEAVANEKIPLVFIRAPFITSVDDKVEILAKIEEKVVAARQGNMLVTSFHPELTDNLEFHRYFIGICGKYAKL
ncbi:pyridoxal 5'-phosphate synthase glutaminase subunit PdxT [Clostridium manihotivorum]|uniref:Pyridoxal 5'-phosphate synthase subunit PdxT n=1 Tax=Clostridium manihotivorum TaxID=2320868 RepID=A0A410DZE9_9CLOT|nr:pyridoxal 5'-phosphate synthase glutaminase subunit PdxT [Clostridium manihotivorum]QAA34424.1 pyridoxal 5'-phosphate synthase glutaminase subunit PdxT [Clostridium manihotivorum]